MSGWRASWSRLSGAFLGVVAVALAAPACQSCKQQGQTNGAPSASVSASSLGLSQEQAARVIAKFGDHSITLGEFAQAIKDMPEFERLRYQALDRRRDLLRSMVDVQLLADEAKKQGLDNDPQTRDEIRQILVTWMRGQLQKSLPAINDIPAAEVRAWYDAHKDRFDEPERRRIAQVITQSEETAKKAYDEAKVAAPIGWGPIVTKYGDDKPGPTEAPELAGDVGFVTAPSDPHPPSNPKVTGAMRKAAFDLTKLGDVSAPFKDEKGWHVLKLVAKNDARVQSFADVERSVRIMLLQEKRTAAEKALIDEIRATTKVEIDEAALSAVASNMALGPSAPPSAGAPSGSASASASASASGSAGKK